MSEQTAQTTRLSDTPSVRPPEHRPWKMTQLTTALRVAARFTGEAQRKMDKVLLRSEQVEATDGAVLLVVPVTNDPPREPARLLPGDQAAQVESLSDVERLVQGEEALVLVSGLFPDTQGVLAKMKALPVQATVQVDLRRLEKLVTALRHLGAERVQLTLHSGPCDAVELLGLTYRGTERVGGEALLMPMR